MPIIKSTYKAPFGFSNGHFQTIFAGAIRRSDTSVYTRERIDTPDGDFLDLDWNKTGGKRCVILSHGLEGSSDRPYATHFSKFFVKNNLSTVVWNFRGCSGEVNKKLNYYYCGDILDLQCVIDRVAQEYEEIYLLSVSLGGNINLKYLGEMAGKIHPKVKSAVVYSVPTDLRGCSIELEKRSNTLYRKRFVKKLKEKVEAKKSQYPDLAMSSEGYDENIKTLRDFDNHYSAKQFGYKDADDYYKQCSCNQYIGAIQTPTLIVNALDDHFLSESCYPKDTCKDHKHVSLEMPKHGGHVGFISVFKPYWSERRALQFFETLK